LLGTITFDFALNPEKYLGPYRLWACVATPQSTGKRREKEQGQAGYNQQNCKIEKILGPKCDPKDMKLAGWKIQ
jgi:hypothetical protein